MNGSRVLRPLGAAGVAAVLMTGVACNGPLARRAARQQQAPATTVAQQQAPPTTAAPAASNAAQPVRTDDLDAGLQQTDAQLNQTGAALSDADQPSQQNND